MKKFKRKDIHIYIKVKAYLIKFYCIDRQKDRKIERQTDRKIERQKDRKIDR